MRVALKNVGDAMRVVYDEAKRPVAIGINKTVEAELPDPLVEKLRAAQAQGDTLHVSRAGGRVRVRPTDDPNEVTPVTVLAQADNLDYHSLLALTKQALPDDKELGPRPTKESMIVALRAAVPK